MKSTTFAKPVTTVTIRYAQEQRLRFFDFLLHQYGVVSRTALVDYYCISEVQASHDIKVYTDIAPNNMLYSRSTRLFERTENFVRVWK